MTFSRAPAFVLAAPALMGLAACGSSPDRSRHRRPPHHQRHAAGAGAKRRAATPDGATVSLAAGNVTVSSPTAFQIFYVFNKVGTYTLRASNPNGAGSNTVSLLGGNDMVRTGLIIGLVMTVGLVTIGHLAGTEVGADPASAARSATPPRCRRPPRRHP